MNITSAFSRGCGGSLTEASAAVYNNTIGTFLQQYSNLTGWLGETVNSVIAAHDQFMSSRMWEFGSRMSKSGHHVGRFEIGYLGEAKFQQQATGFMRNYIMANPAMMELYQQERASGYLGEFSELCSGIGTENYFYNKAMDGLVTHNEDGLLMYTTFNSSRDDNTHLTTRERFDISRTWRASNHHIAEGLFDPSNALGGEFLSDEEVVEMRLERSRKEAEERARVEA